MRTRTYQESYAALTRLLPYRSSWGWYLALLVLLLLLPFVVPTYFMTKGTLVFIGAIGAIGLNLVTGTAGLISLGQAGFLAIGAYTAAILITDHGWGIPAALAAAGVVSGLISILVGVPSLRLKGLYLAITTLAFSLIAVQLINQAEWLTGGSGGKSVGRPDLLGISMRSAKSMYYLSLTITVATIFAAANLLRSRVGRAWSALREHDVAASLMGVNLARYKLLAFAVSSFIVGVAGALFGLHLRYLNVDSFELIASIEAITMIIVGGLGSVRGAVLGAVLVAVLPDASRSVFDAVGGPLRAISAANAPELKGVIYALVILLFLRFEPDGLASRWAHVKRFWSDWPFSRKAA